MQDTQSTATQVFIKGKKSVTPHAWDRHFSRTLHYAMLAVGIALVAGSALVAQAQTSAEVAVPAAVVGPTLGVPLSPTTEPGQAAASVPVLTIRDVYDKLAAQGYREFREIEWENGRYEVKAKSSDGRPVKVYVDGRSGMVLGLRSHH